MDYLIKVNAYVKQEDIIYLRNIKPEDIEKKIETFINKKTNTKTTSVLLRFIPCIAAYNSMEVVFSDYDDFDDYDNESEDDEDDELFSWATFDELEEFFMGLLPIKFKGIVVSESNEANEASETLWE